MGKIMNLSLYTLSFVLVITIIGCGEDFITRAPLSEANVEIFYNDIQDFEVAINGAYAQLRAGGMYGQAHWVFGDVRSDNTFNGRPFEWIRDHNIFEVQTTNDVLSSYWNAHYSGLMRVNSILDRIVNVDFDDPILSRIEGEAKFLRGLIYFNLVRAFGDVPLVLEEMSNIQEAYDVLRTDSDQVYETIINDLQDAAELLPEKSEYALVDLGRATKGAADALLGKVYLTLHNYESARNSLETVINSGQYNLWENYADIFHPDNANGIESIFEVQFKKGGTGTGSNFMHQFAPFASTVITQLGEGTGVNEPTEDMSESYEIGDIRKDISMADGYENSAGNWVDQRYVRKYLDEPFAPGDNDNNWIVLRYADVLLMYSEVLNELGQTGDALSYVNQIRERADLDGLNGLTQQELRLAIENERRAELAFEGHRWWDLVRTERAIEVMNAKFPYNVTETDLVWPIPQSVRDTNPAIQQNPGYPGS